MKKLITLLIAASFTIGLSGCFLMQKYSDPKSIIIDGHTYVTGFYENLWPNGITVGEERPTYYESAYHYWWKVENAPFDMYCAQNKEALYWNPAIYCRESEFEEVNRYYSDPQNYDYFIGIYLEDEQHIRLSEQDEPYAERAIEFIIEMDNALGAGGIFDPLQDKKITLDAEFFDWDRVTIYRTSKDGFFTTLHMELAIYDGALYRQISYDESKKQTTFYVFDKDVSDYMVDLFEKYVLS